MQLPNGWELKGWASVDKNSCDALFFTQNDTNLKSNFLNFNMH